MQAIRQFIKVNGRNINITLPDDFNADEVEIIILPKNDDTYLTDEMKAILDSRVNEPSEDYISAKESIEKLKNKYGL
jgi:hypothetical protein